MAWPQLLVRGCLQTGGLAAARRICQLDERTPEAGLLILQKAVAMNNTGLLADAIIFYKTCDSAASCQRRSRARALDWVALGLTHSSEMSARRRAKNLDFGQMWLQLDRLWPTSAKIGPEASEAGGEVGRVRLKSARVVSMLDNLGNFGPLGDAPPRGALLLRAGLVAASASTFRSHWAPPRCHASRAMGGPRYWACDKKCKSGPRRPHRGATHVVSFAAQSDDWLSTRAFSALGTTHGPDLSPVGALFPDFDQLRLDVGKCCGPDSAYFGRLRPHLARLAGQFGSSSGMGPKSGRIPPNLAEQGHNLTALRVSSRGRPDRLGTPNMLFRGEKKACRRRQVSSESEP